VKAGKADQQVLVTDAFKEESSVIIQWEALVSNLLGYRVVYRLFGDAVFKQGPPLSASEREFRIKNVPGEVSPMSFISICEKKKRKKL
jgi:hypothetical protein